MKRCKRPTMGAVSDLLEVLVEKFEQRRRKLEANVSEGVLLAADLADSYMGLFDLALRRNDDMKAREYMLKTRALLKTKPYAPHRPHLTIAWRKAVSKYNSKVEEYRDRLIDLKPIETGR